MSLLKELKKIRMRLKYGVKEELLALLQLKGVGRVRARKLYANKLKNLGDLRRVELATLQQLVGKAVSASIKNQLGEKVQSISEEKTKSLLSYDL